MFPVMCYDYHGKWDKKTGHNAPLKSRPDEKGNDLFFNLEYTVEYLVKKGAKPEKTVLGVPLYGRAFLLKNSHDDRMGAPAQSNSFAGITRRSNARFDRVKNSKISRTDRQTHRVTSWASWASCRSQKM